MEIKTEDKKQEQSHDLTSGAIIPSLLQFAWPLFIGNIFQQLYNTVDSIIVGNFVGANALAAIGVYTPIYNLLLGLFQGIATGATVVVSHAYGAKDQDKLNKTVYVSIVLTIVVGIVISVLGLLVCDPLLRLINTPADIFTMSVSYANIMFAGVLTVLMYNILCGVLRGMGDSFWPLIFLIISSVINVVLDYIFVVDFGWGLEGAAYATIIAQTVSALVSFIYLLKTQNKYGLSLKMQKPDMEQAKAMLNIGIPTGLQTALFNVGFLVLQNLVNSFGSTVVAAYSIVTRVDSFAMLPMNSFSIALTTFVGQNVGAKKLNRALKGIKKVFWLSQAIDCLMVGLLYIFVADVMKWFTNDTAVIETGIQIIRIFCIGYIICNALIILGGAVRGFGDTMATLIASFTCNVVFRVVLAYVFVRFTHDYRMIFVAIDCAWTAYSIFMIVYYKKGVWRKKLPAYLF